MKRPTCLEQPTPGFVPQIVEVQIDDVERRSGYGRQGVPGRPFRRVAVRLQYRRFLGAPDVPDLLPGLVTEDVAAG